VESTGGNPFSPFPCTQTRILGLALGKAGTESILEQGCGMSELAHPPSRPHAEAVAALTALPTGLWEMLANRGCELSSS